MAGARGGQNDDLLPSTYLLLYLYFLSNRSPTQILFFKKGARSLPSIFQKSTIFYSFRPQVAYSIAVEHSTDLKLSMPTSAGDQKRGLARYFEPERRHGPTIEYQAMPSLRDVAHDEWVYTFTIIQQLEIPSARSWAAPVRVTGTVWKKGGTARPSRTYHTCRVTLPQSARRAAVLGQPSGLQLYRLELNWMETLEHFKCEVMKDPTGLWPLFHPIL
jgi:hypothetical protein